MIYSVRSFRVGQDSIPGLSSDVCHVAQNAAICFKRHKLELSCVNKKTENEAYDPNEGRSANIARSLPILHFCLRELKCGVRPFAWGR